MTASDDTDPPLAALLLDPAVLRDLEGDVGSRAAASFAREFAGMWPRRRAALTMALARTDTSAAMEAILSLRVSSAMVGARRLEDLATRLETSLRNHGLAEAMRFAEDLELCGEQTVRLLAAHSEPGNLPS